MMAWLTSWWWVGWQADGLVDKLMMGWLTSWWWAGWQADDGLVDKLMMGWLTSWWWVGWQADDGLVDKLMMGWLTSWEWVGWWADDGLVDKLMMGWLTNWWWVAGGRDSRATRCNCSSTMTHDRNSSTLFPAETTPSMSSPLTLWVTLCVSKTLTLSIPLDTGLRAARQEGCTLSSLQ